jgi:hypothetical protein
MRFARGDMRDHIASHKNDYGASYRRYGVLQRRSRLKISFCEIFGVSRFSTFATISVKSRHLRRLSPRPLYPPKADIGQHGRHVPKCHVWTAPGWQELFSRFAALVGAAMCSAF